MINLFKKPIRATCLNGDIWITGPGAESYLVTKPSDLQTLENDGVLPNSVSTSQLNHIIQLCQRARAEVNHTSGGRTGSIAYAVVLIMAVFFLGTGMLYEKQQASLQSTNRSSCNSVYPNTFLPPEKIDEIPDILPFAYEVENK